MSISKFQDRFLFTDFCQKIFYCDRERGQQSLIRAHRRGNVRTRPLAVREPQNSGAYLLRKGAQ